MTDILAAAGGLFLRVLVGMGALLALLVPVLAIVGVRLLWDYVRHHGHHAHAHHRHAH
ncbi:MAG TPA: hypothetical protein VLU24_05410 [Mycobacterium sp.]|nr:hypothetical protein [Mycobacterium sp.]